jgi:hypothetical protein
MKIEQSSLPAAKVVTLSIVIAAYALADWGSITINDGGGDATKKSVAFENSVMLLKYSYNTCGTKPQDVGHTIKDLTIKGKSSNMAGCYLDCSAHRGNLSSAGITEETDTKKTASLKWAGGEASVTIYRHQPFVKIANTKNGPNVVDISAIGGGNYVIYGSENWKRDFIGYPKCYYHTGDQHCADQNGESSSNDDPSPLLYNGWFIAGVFDPSTGNGWARLMPKKIRIIKLLFGQGYEWFWNDYTGYLFVVTGGKDEILSGGKAIADWANGGEQGLPFGDVPVAGIARDAPGAKFYAMLAVQSRNTKSILLTVDCPEKYRLAVYGLDGSVKLRALGAGRRRYEIDAGSMPAGTYVAEMRSRNAISAKRLIIGP